MPRLLTRGRIDYLIMRITLWKILSRSYYNLAL
jgi:hypothetical protein